MPNLDHFQALTTAVAVLARSVKPLAAAKLPEISAAQKEAWSALTRPERAINIILQAQGNGINLAYFGPEYAHNPVYAQHARFLPTLSERDCSLLAQGLLDCAAHIRAIAQAPAFAEAGALHSPLICAPGGAPQAPELAYPMMGLSLKAGRTTIDNKRAETLVGHSLFRAGDIHLSSSERYQRGNHISPAAWLAGQAAPEPEALAALDAARKATAAQGSDLDSQYVRFGAALRSEAPVELSADLPLPSVALMRERATRPESTYRRDGSMGLGSQGGPKAELAPGQAARAANAMQAIAGLNALSLALSGPEDQPLASRLGPQKRLTSTPLAQAQPRSETSLLDAHNHTLTGLFTTRETSGAYNDLARANGIPQGPVSDELLDPMMAPLLAAATASTAITSMAERARHSFLSNSTFSSLASFGPLGLGLPGLSRALATADPRMGLLQWCLSASTFDTEKAQQTLPQLTQDRAALLGSMLEVRSAISAAQGVFFDSAMAAAEKAESDWMNERALLPAWRQALSSGSVSARSIAWAKLNPASSLLASDNPMEALGARCAKAWGLRVGDQGGEAFLASFQQALQERGGESAAWSALTQNANLRERLAALTAATAVVEKPIAQTARGALAFYIRAVERSAAMGMAPEEIDRFTRAYIEPELPEAKNHDYYRRQAQTLTFAQRIGSLEFFSTSGTIAAGSWDGLSPGLGLARLSNGPIAELARDLNAGKAAQYDALVDALATDWAETVGSCVESGQSALSAEPIARARACELAYAFPTNGVNSFDWRQPVFSDAPAWRALGIPSPRYSAAANAALSQGPLGVWSAGLARDLDIRDAKDGNDLIGQTRDAVKRLTGLSDGAWRQAIKHPAALEYLRAQMNAKASEVALERRLPAAEQGAIQAARVSSTFDSSGAQEAKELAEAQLRARDAGRLLSMAASLNLPIDKALEAGRALPSDLFSSTIGSLELAGADGASFYIHELNAKRDRAPHILKEAVKRLEKLQKDALAPIAEGQTRQTAAQAFSAETTDLADWIKNSEPGLWQELPAAPTWNQLRRASAEWHEEQAAIARDKNERRMAREAKEAANEIMLHVEAASGDPAQAVKVGARNLMGEFANPTGSSWPKALGRYARDGWEAVELLTASQLTEEGAAMSHCVSSYSGQCRSGTARIFSVRLNGERVCTLQISGPAPLAKLDEKASFNIAQNKGKHNAAITSNAALAFCSETLEAFGASWRSMCQKRRELIAAEIARKKAEESGEAAPKAKPRKPKAA